MTSQQVCPACGWTLAPPAPCQNPDCKKGRKARPSFRPIMRTQRGHGVAGRVRMYRGEVDATIDPDERDDWTRLTRAQRTQVAALAERWIQERNLAVRITTVDDAGIEIDADKKVSQRVLAELERAVEVEIRSLLGKPPRRKRTKPRQQWSESWREHRRKQREEYWTPDRKQAMYARYETTQERELRESGNSTYHEPTPYEQEFLREHGGDEPVN